MRDHDTSDVGREVMKITADPFGPIPLFGHKQGQTNITGVCALFRANTVKRYGRSDVN